MFGHSLISHTGQARRVRLHVLSMGVVHTVRLGPVAGGSGCFLSKISQLKNLMLSRSVSCLEDNNYKLAFLYMQVVFSAGSTQRHPVIQLFVHKILKMLFRVANEVSSLFRQTYINGIKWHQTVTLLTFLHSCTAKGYPRQCSKWSPIWCVLVPEGDVTPVAGNVGARLHSYHPQHQTCPGVSTPHRLCLGMKGTAQVRRNSVGAYSQVSSKFVQDLKSWRSCAKCTGTGLEGRFCKVRILRSTTTPKCCLADVLQLDQGSGIARTGQSQRDVLWMLIWLAFKIPGLKDYIKWVQLELKSWFYIFAMKRAP